MVAARGQREGNGLAKAVGHRAAPQAPLTGLEAPSAAPSLLVASLGLRLFPGPGCRLLSLPLVSASPMSTPLSSLRVCPLSDSWESVEAGERRGVGGWAAPGPRGQGSSRRQGWAASLGLTPKHSPAEPWNC